jgi:hypothetical protein
MWHLEARSFTGASDNGSGAGFRVEIGASSTEAQATKFANLFEIKICKSVPETDDRPSTSYGHPDCISQTCHQPARELKPCATPRPHSQIFATNCGTCFLDFRPLGRFSIWANIEKRETGIAVSKF